MHLRTHGRGFCRELLGGTPPVAACSTADCSPSLSHTHGQKYGNVAFDSNQKAVLTSCVLRYKPLLPSSGAITPARVKDTQPPPNEEGFISCCFSFTIRRDPYGIPTLIVGNFIKC